ncbi:MAG TPA: DUF302 domain-containing protein [Candidatus Limnocylindria bacterium]|nr:DUF302 domain-containing protein [Candidatus Limnocylindria bacterium]
MKTAYTFGRRLPGTPADLRLQVEDALKAQGFGVITEIDVAAVLKTKIGVDSAPYLILGACNPNLAYQAIDIDPSVGTLLPCNVVLRSEGDITVVEAIDPVEAMEIAASPRLLAVAMEARARLARAIGALRARPVAKPRPAAAAV